MSDSNSVNGASAGEAKSNTISKAAGVMVFSGIAISLLKTLYPCNRNANETQQPLTESTQSIQIPSQTSNPVELVEKKVTYIDKNVPETLESSQGRIETVNGNKASEASQRRIQIVKGDTLWGLSKKYGVSIDAIKEANGLEGNTIYAGKKLIIP